MIKRKISAILGLVAVAIIALSCGSSSQQVAGVDIIGTGAGSGATSLSGQITQFGSVYVGGTRYDVSQAQVTLDDKASTASALRLGMWVTVDTNGQDTNATRIRYRSHLAGDVSNLDTVAKTFTVHNKKIFVDTRTNYGTLKNFAALTADSDVIVSGEYLDSSTLHATFIDLNQENLVLDRDSDFHTEDSEDGEQVILSGRFIKANSSTEIVVNEYTVQIDSSTEIEKAISSLSVNEVVIIEGEQVQAKVIKASEIKSTLSTESEVEGSIENLTSDPQSITISGQVYKTTTQSIYSHSDPDNYAGSFGFAQLSVGQAVEVEYSVSGSDRLIVHLKLE